MSGRFTSAFLPNLKPEVIKLLARFNVTDEAVAEIAKELAPTAFRRCSWGLALWAMRLPVVLSNPNGSLDDDGLE